MEALQDLDYSNQCALKGDNDPFLVTTKKTVDRLLIKEIEEKWLREARDSAHDSWSLYGCDKDRYLIPRLEEDIRMVGELAEVRDKAKIELFGGSRNARNKNEALKSFLQRVGMACLGGALLIGPMILMVLHKSLLTTLLTTSVCVFIFGLIMAKALDQPFDVLSATAAYAAVLVVFVGASSGG